MNNISYSSIVTCIGADVKSVSLKTLTNDKSIIAKHLSKTY